MSPAVCRCVKNSTVDLLDFLRRIVLPYLSNTATERRDYNNKYLIVNNMIASFKTLPV